MMPTQPNLTAAETRLGGALPHRRVEAWKWTDVRARVKDDASGLVSACEPTFDLPDGLSVTRSTKNAKENAMGALANSFAGEAYVIDVPAGFNTDAPLKISGLSAGHVRIFVKLGKGAELSVNEDHRSNSAGFANISIMFSERAHH